MTVRIHGEASRVMLCVHNEGPLIPDDPKQRLFRPLQRARKHDANAGRSTCPGLFLMSRTRCEAMTSDTLKVSILECPARVASSMALFRLPIR
ncbi:hypothetical protein ACN469_11740 [Corallococcus terminator]